MASREPGHDFAKDRGVVLGLGLPFGLLDAQTLEVTPQSRQRTLVEESRQVVRSIGSSSPRPTPTKRSKYSLPTRSTSAREAASPRRRMCNAERTWVAAQSGQARQQLSVGATRKQGRQQRVLLRASRIDLVDW